MYQKNKTKLLTQTILPTKYGVFKLYIFKKSRSIKNDVVLVYGNIEDKKKPLPIRIHSNCLTGNVFGSLRCDCGKQLEVAMKLITQDGSGIIIYLDQEGRGIGLINKIKSYALQDAGYDTVEANRLLGFAADLRTYEAAIEILKFFNVSSVKLMTNNPAKIEALKKAGFLVKRHPLWVGRSTYNKKYLATKVSKMNHLS